MPKCRVCKKTLKSTDDITKSSKVAYYHVDCYMNSQLEKLVDIEEIKKVIEQGKKEIEESKQKNKVYKDSSVVEGRDELIKWVQEEYDISVLGRTFYIKMASIANGTYKGLRDPVPYTDLHDMLKRKKKELDIQLASKDFNSNLGRLFYDIAIVLSKYDSYKKWKSAQRVQEQEIIEEIKSKKQPVNKVVKNKDYEKDESLVDILDDIFG